MDNMYNVNDGRYVVRGDVNLDDLLNSVPGGVVRAGSDGQVEPLVTPPFGTQVANMLEFLTVEREQRTGVMRYNQGQDSNITKTASGIGALMGAGNSRVELIARIFAETGVRELFLQMLRLVSRYQNRPRIMRMRGQWIPIDPREWEDQLDIAVNVGLGTGSREYVAAQAQAILQIQERLAQAGLGGSLVTPENVYKALKTWLSSVGFKGDGGFFQDPSQTPPQPPKPDPKMIEVQQTGQIEAAKLMLEREKMLLDHHAAMSKLHMDHGHPPPPMPALMAGLNGEVPNMPTPTPMPVGNEPQGVQ
jgi:hypothetical protein